MVKKACGEGANAKCAIAPRWQCEPWQQLLGVTRPDVYGLRKACQRDHVPGDHNAHRVHVHRCDAYPRDCRRNADRGVPAVRSKFQNAAAAACGTPARRRYDAGLRATRHLEPPDIGAVAFNRRADGQRIPWDSSANNVAQQVQLLGVRRAHWCEAQAGVLRRRAEAQGVDPQQATPPSFWVRHGGPQRSRVSCSGMQPTGQDSSVSFVVGVCSKKDIATCGPDVQEDRYFRADAPLLFTLHEEPPARAEVPRPRVAGDFSV
mmetsp:Transcript_79420/g.221018  ORF Transcript_79420/g.221018 Transcript_79420/m.221018 type:complete len:262 (-) Transcript_79420:488-1273(-)